MSRYKILTGLVKTNGNNNMVSNALDMAIEQLTKARASMKDKNTVVATGGTVGFLLELDDRQKDKRLQPAQSPERKRKRR
jgi:hypothetical protein